MEKIFYTKDDNNEIYECKIERLLISASRTKRLWDKNYFEILLMEVNVAQEGHKVFVRYGSGKISTISINNIYLSVEDVKNDKPLFNYCSQGCCFEDTPFFKSIICMKNNPPYNSNWGTRTDGIGMSAISARTWEWDGLQARETNVKSPLVIYANCDARFTIPNSYGTLIYDVVRKSYIHSEEQDKTWRTRAECVYANTIKVHTF